MGRRINASALAAVLSGVLACGTGTDGGNRPPVADAGPDREVPFGRLVVVSGACTDPDPEDRGQLVHRWTLHAVPDGSARSQADVAGADGPDAWLEADRPGPYVFGLACRDPHDWGEEDRVTITVADPPPNRPPTVDAGGDLSVALGTPVVLEARAFDADGDAVAFAWTLTDVPAGSGIAQADLVGADGPVVRWLPDVAGVFRAQVSASDGRGGEATDAVTVTVAVPAPLDRDLTVNVVDARTLRPIEGARVVVDDRLIDGTTGADGRLEVSGGWLRGPVDVTVIGPGEVTWRHDGDRDTEDLTEPRWRMRTWTGVDRPSLTVALELTEGGRQVADTGRVWGSVPWQVFDELPEVHQMYSIAGARMSGQFRMVLVTPMMPLDWLAEPAIQDVLAPALAPSATVTLPGNLTSDDAFLHDVAGLIGRYNGPRGEPPFSMFEIPMPAGPGHVVLLGGIVTGDLANVLPGLIRPASDGHLQSELGYVLGALSFTTLFVGIVPVDVPAGGRIEISDALSRPEDWPVFEKVIHDRVRYEEEACDHAGVCADLDRIRIFPADRLVVRTPALPADPRLAEAVPAESEYDVLCGGDDGMLSHCDPPRTTNLPVPEDVGTAMPYALHSIYLEVPRGDPRMPEGGLVLAGFRFSERIAEEETHSVFAVPRLEGDLEGLSYAAMSIAYRRFRFQRAGGRLSFREGWSTDSRRGLYPGLTVDLDPTSTQPRLPDGAGALSVEVIFDVDDPTSDTPEIRFAHAMSNDPVPGDSPETLARTIPVSEAPEGVSLRRLTLAEVDRVTSDGRLLPIVLPRWDVMHPAGTTEVRWPVLPDGLVPPWSEGAEVWTRIVEETRTGTYDFQAPDPARLRRGTVADGWSWQAP